jgi:uncharacterized protein (TIGR02284 family)
MRVRGLRGGSFVKSFPFALLFMRQVKTARCRRKLFAEKIPALRAGGIRIGLTMSQQKEIISTINGLIETLKDGQQGFREASEAVKDTQLKSLFSEYSLQRAKFAGELQNEAITLGEHNPEDSSSTAGAWINLKSAITSADDHAILAECERGEDSAVNEYKKAMEGDKLSATIRDTIARQYTDVKQAHDHIKALRDASKNN